MALQRLDTDLADAMWWGTETLRLRAHRARGLAWCPTRVVPYGATDPSARRIHPRCLEDGCLGIVHDVYGATTERLGRPAIHEEAIRDKVPYVRRVVASQVAELDRKSRVARGLPAKPTRTDGIPGRVIAALRRAERDPIHVAWDIQLFRMIRSYVCRANRLTAAWPTDMWAAEKSLVDGRIRALGTEAVQREITGDIGRVVELARRTVGASWVADTITGPLLATVEPLPDDSDSAVLVDPSDLAEQVLVRLLRARYAAARPRQVTGGVVPRGECRGLRTPAGRFPRGRPIGTRGMAVGA